MSRGSKGKGRDSAAIRRLKEYYRVPAHTIEPADLFKALKKETDRSFIVVLASVIEDRLGYALRDKLRPMEPKEEKALGLFLPDGAFGTFSSKIDMGYVLRVIDAGLHEQLHCVRELRNAAAHSMKPISFETDEVIAVCKQLFEGESSFYVPGRFDDPPTLRATFGYETIAYMMAVSEGEEAARRFVVDNAVKPLPL